MRIRWTPERTARLGKEPDKVIAASLGITVYAVVHKRWILRIPRYCAPAPRWTPAMISRLGKMTDREFAATYGLSYRQVFYKRRSLGLPGCRTADQ